VSCGDLAQHPLGGRAPVLQFVVSRVPRCGSRTGSPLPFRRLSPRGWPGTILPPSAGGVGINPDRCSIIELRVRRSTHRTRAACQSKRPFSGRCRVRSWLRSTLPRGKTVVHFENRLCLRTSRSKLGGPMSRYRPGRGRIQANKVRPSNPAAPVGRLRHSRRWWSSKDGGFGGAAVAFRGRR
jgi:hypothetical protein